MDTEVVPEEPTECPNCHRPVDRIDITEVQDAEPQFVYLCPNVGCPTLYVQPRRGDGPGG